MSNTTTQNKSLVIQGYNTADGTLPTSAVAAPFSSGTTYPPGGWDVPLNYNASALDIVLGGAAQVSVTGASGLTALTPDKYQPMAIIFKDTLTANVTYTLPSGVGGTWIMQNNTSGSYTITIQSLTSGATTTLTLPQDGLTYSVTCVAVSGGGVSLTYALPNNAVTTQKIADGAVTEPKLADYSVSNTKPAATMIRAQTSTSSSFKNDQFLMYDDLYELTISGITVSGSGPTYTATATTSSAHGYSTGNIISVFDATGNTSVNGTFSITVTGTTTFTYTVTASGAVGGTPACANNAQAYKRIKKQALDNFILPPGVIIPYAGTNTSNLYVTYAGWLLCDGSAVSRSAYPYLYAAIGTTYGSGDGSTTFNLPDLRGRVPAGKDNMGGTSANRLTGSLTGGVDGDVLGNTGGNEGNTLDTTQIPAHTHTYGPKTGRYGSFGQTYPTNEFQPSAGNSDQGTQTMTSNPTGGGLAHNNVQPTIILNYLIKADMP